MTFVPMLLALLSTADSAETVRISVAPAESLTVTMTGEGTPVVLIPGLFGSAYSYRRVTALLDGAGYRSLVIEPLGIGTSSRPQDADYSLTAQADRIAAVMDSLRVEGAVLVAHSHGSSMALRLAYRHPQLVRGVVSIEGGAAEAAASRGFRRAMRFAPALRMLDGRQMVQGLIFGDMKKSSADDSWVTPQVVRAYVRGLDDDFDATLHAYQGMARSEEPERLRDHLGSIGCPVQLLVGDKDHGSGPPDDEVETLASLLPAFTVDTVSASGFFIQEEQPASVAAAVEAMSAGPAC